MINVTKSNQETVNLMKKLNSDSEVAVEIWENKSTKYIHTVKNDVEMLSVSKDEGKQVTEKDIYRGASHLMGLGSLDVMFRKQPSGVVIVTKKPDSIPRYAN